MRLQRNHKGVLQLLKSKLESFEQRQKQHILCQIFPDVTIKWIKYYLDQISITSYHLNQSLFIQDQYPTHVYYIIEGEVRLEETLKEIKKLNSSLYSANYTTKNRILMILSSCSLVGEIEALLDRQYKMSAKCNVQHCRILSIPIQAFIELKKHDYGNMTPEEQHLKDELILKKLYQLKQRRLELNEGTPDIDCSPITKKSREECIVQQNKRVQKKNFFEYINLTPEAPLFQFKKVKRVAAAENVDESRVRSRSAPTKAKMMMSTGKTIISSDKTSKPEEIFRNRTRTIDCRTGQRIVWQQIYQKL